MDFDGTLTDADAQAASAPRHPAAGEQLDRYIIVDPIGEGGMGAVYRAYDPELDRGVAIKLVHEHRVHRAEDRQRILREARAIAKLSHPNVVAVYDVGEHRGAVFIVMELVRGSNLAEWTAASARSAEEVLDVYRAAAAGICAAHDAGLVHRDIKPRNILIGTDGRVRVADFGLARALDSEASTDEHVGVPGSSDHSYSDTVTDAGVLVGSPAYMAPERIAGKPSDARSDQFSFCVSLFESLIGERPPRDDDRNVQFDGAALRDAPLYARRALEVGLRSQPERRFASMAALLEALEPPRPRRVGAIVALVVVALVAVGLLYASQRADDASCEDLGAPMRAVWNPNIEAAVVQAFAASGHPDGAIVAKQLVQRINGRIDTWTRDRTEACRATERGEQSAPLLDRRMACYERQLTTMRTYAEVWRDAPDPNTVENAIARFDRAPDGSDCAAATLVASAEIPTTPEAAAVMALVDESYARRQLLREAEALTLAERAITAARATGNDKLIAEGEYSRAQALRWLERPADAVEALYACVEHASAARDDRLVAIAVSDLVFVLGDRLGHADEAVCLGRIGQGLVKRAGNDDMLRVRIHSDLGVALQKAGRLEESERHLRIALEIRRAHRDEHPYELANACNRLGNTLFYGGRLDDAEALFRESMAVLDAVEPRSTRWTRATALNLANVFAERGDRERAIAQWKQIAEEELAAYGQDSPELVYPYINIAWGSLDTRQFDQAATWAHKSVLLHERLERGNHPIMAASKIALAAAKLHNGEQAEGLRLLDEAEAILGDSGKAELANVHFFRGEAHRRSGDITRARRAYEAALATHTQLETPEVRTAAPRFGLAQVLHSQGDRAVAVKHAKRALQSLRDSEVDVPYLADDIERWLASLD